MSKISQLIAASIGLLIQFHSAAQLEQQVTDYVNPMIGTDRMGHTYPGASAPFGMVQLSPETNRVPMIVDGKYNPLTYAYCAGYQYQDTLIYGFAHTHFSGTGHSDLGDVLLLPVSGNSKGGEIAFSTFSHASERAKPGYYAVELESEKIGVELTATERVGMHKYTFHQSGDAQVLLDMTYNIYDFEGKDVWTFIRVENSTTITGYRQTHGWGRTRTVYFAIEFSKPFKSYGHKKINPAPYNGFYRKFDEGHNFPEMAGKNIRAWFDFEVDTDEEILAKVALSNTSTAGALLNLESELRHWDFEKAYASTQDKWTQALSKVDATFMTEDQCTIFYTALYHTMLGTIIYEDVDGTYRGLDQNLHQSDGFTNYTVFSLWDTYRALHPLYNLIQPQRNNDMVHSMLAHHDQSVHHMLPVWSHYANENWCMIGYHAVSVLADAAVKKTTDVPMDRLLQAAMNTGNVSYFDGLGEYRRLGYVPEDKSSNSVSKTLEYAYDDWCIAQLANKAGNAQKEKYYLDFSTAYEQVYDPTIGYMRPKLADGSWRPEFDPMDTHGQGFIEGNALNYGLYVPQNVPRMIELMGGKQSFTNHLDEIFLKELDDKYIEKNEDITRDGIIGAYVHGNEPGHHIPYLYNWAGRPDKTQQRVRMIMETMYTNDNDGLCGNDDAGQMSAWYVFSALGFYPVLPGSTEYAVGSPLVKEATLRFENGKELHIVVKGQSAKNVYVKEVWLNGKKMTGWTLDHMDLIEGGELIFVMRAKPN